MLSLYLASVTLHVLAALLWLGGMFFLADFDDGRPSWPGEMPWWVSFWSGGPSALRAADD